MTTYVMRNGKLVDKSRAPPVNRGSAAPGVISDIMEPTRHMCDNKLYTSKARFRETTRAYGCVEVGNDPAILRPRAPVQMSREQRRNDIRRALQEVRNRA